MKTLPLIIILIITCSCKSVKIQDHRYKTFRPAKVEKVKLKKTKIPKQHWLNELSKREKKLKAYKPGKKIQCNSPAYTNKTPLHYWNASKKINKKYFCTQN